MARADAKGSMGSSGMDPAIMDPLPRLLTAVQDDDCLMVRRILGRGDFGVVDVNQMDVFGNTPMHWAVTRGNTEILEHLINAPGAKVNLPNEEDQTALMRACRLGRCEAAKMLIAAKANVTQVDKDGSTALMKAAWSGNVPLIQILLDAFAHPSTIDKRKRTAMHHAANQGHAGAIQRLWEAKCPVDTPDFDEWTPLMHASNNGHYEAAKNLLELGANCMSRSETHNSACDYAWNLRIRSMLSKAMKKAEAEEEQKKKQQKEEEAAKVQQMRDDEAAREASAMGGDPVVTAKLRKIFGMFDEDSGGDIGKEEFTALCRLIKFPFTEDSELDSILDAFDLSGDQNISYDEFVKWWATNETARDAIEQYAA